MSIFLICSIIVGVIILGIIFLFVCMARKKFLIAKQILKPINVSSQKTVYDFFVGEQKNGKFLDTQMFEGGTYCYYPKSKTVCIESDALRSMSVFDIGATAHELGHAYAQHKNSKLFSLWYALSTFEKIFCWTILPLFFAGLILSFIPTTSSVGTVLLNTSTVISVVILIGRVVTIPTEKEASDYAIKLLQEAKIFGKNEEKMCKKMLSIALSTYVFAFYERLFINFILAKRLFCKIFRIKPKQKTLKTNKNEKEINELISIIKEDNALFAAQTEEEKRLEEQKMLRQQELDELNTIKMPKLDE